MCRRLCPQHLARVENPIGVEQALEAAHELERYRIFDARQELTLHDANAMLGRDRAAEPRHDSKNCIIDLVPARQEGCAVGANRLADVVMDVAVTEMSKRNRPAARIIASTTAVAS